MLVLNHRNGLHHVGDSSSGKASLTFLPGLNDVDEKAFTKALELPAFKALVDDEVMEVVLTKAGKPVAAAEVAQLPEKQTLALVAETVDSKLLKAWQLTEKRQPVLDAIQAQLDAIDPRKK
jgi:hypothetical protein